MKRKWQGTTLFVAIFAGLAATLGLRLLQSPTAAVGTSQAAAAGATTPTGSATAPASSSSGGTSGNSARTVSGASENTPYGNVQVDVQFSGKTISGIKVVTIPDSSNYDQNVAQAVPPILLKEILASQSTNVSTVSGGTYTSNGYLQSVQSAIDKLG